MHDEPAHVLVKYQEYLLLLARIHFDKRLRPKCSPSDIVQETLLEACRDWDQYRGTTTREQAAWLRKILANTIVDHQRRFLGKGRDISLERSLEKVMDDSSVRLGAMAFSNETLIDRMVQEEVSIQVAQALSELPPLQYESIVRHHLEGEPVSAIAHDLDSTSAAIAGHLRRGLAQLRKRLDSSKSRAS